MGFANSFQVSEWGFKSLMHCTLNTYGKCFCKRFTIPGQGENKVAGLSYVYIFLGDIVEKYWELATGQRVQRCLKYMIKSAVVCIQINKFQILPDKDKIFHYSPDDDEYIQIITR